MLHPLLGMPRVALIFCLVVSVVSTGSAPSQFFFQVIEGPPDAIEVLRHRLLRDHRHRNVTTLMDISCAERLYRDWTMKFTDMKSIALHPTINLVLPWRCLTLSAIRTRATDRLFGNSLCRMSIGSTR